MHASVFLAFLPRPEGGTAPLTREWAQASDWFVLFTLATLWFLLGAFAAAAWILWRRTTRPQPHVRLLMELENTPDEERKPAPAGDKPGPAAPWEKSADWWKKAPED